VIPDAAVEAAYLQLPYDAVPFVDIDMMHIILEAAAPHMRAEAWEDREGAEDRVKSIVQDVAMTVDYTERLYTAVQEIMDITMPRTAK
jgi:hypothetical protein